MLPNENRCTNCGADLNVVRIVACCNHPGRVIDFPMDFPDDPRDATIARLTAENEALRAQIGAVPRKTFPILNGNGAQIDYQLVVDHGGQAKQNHCQSVDRLAQRGGLSWCELHAVLHNRRYQKIDTNDAMIACRSIEARYLAALNPDAPAALARAQADVAKRAWQMAAGIVDRLTPVPDDGPFSHSHAARVDAIDVRNALLALCDDENAIRKAVEGQP